MAGQRDKELALGETVAQTPDASGGSTPTEATAPAQPVSPQQDLPRGTTIDERYLIEAAIGRGGMGTVYRARDASLGRDVALKLHRHGSNHDRLYREALAMAQLAHPNVVTVFEVGAFDDQLFVAMEYLAGGTLRDWLAARRHTWRETLEILLDVGEGLAAAHKVGLVHRDFKPENVLVGDDGRPRVGDFGLARANAAMTSQISGTQPIFKGASPSSPPLATPVPTSAPMTITGALLGTPAYMPPEQYAGVDVDARGDQFSYCVAAWECLFGKRPFAGSTLPVLQQAIERRRIEEPELGDVPPALRRVLERGLSPVPTERWPDMAALLAALRAAARPRARWPFVLAGGAVLAATAGIVAWTHAREAPAVTPPPASACGGAGAEIDTLIPATLRDGVIARAGEAGADAAARTRRYLAQFATTYRDSARTACQAVERHDWSPDLAARSDSCRDEQARNAATDLAMLLEGHGEARKALAESAELFAIADLGTCTDAKALLVRPVRDPAQRVAIASARAELLGAARLADSNSRDRAKAVVDRITAQPIADAAGVAAPLETVQAILAHVANDYDGAVRTMSEAYYKAHADGDQQTEMMALEHLLYWIGSDRQDRAGVESWYRLALSEVPRYQQLSPVQAAKLRIALVGVAVTRDELPVAIEQARLASEALEHGPPIAHASALHEYANAVATAGDADKAIPIYEQCVKQIEEALGPDDANLATALSDLSLTYGDARRYDEAIEVGDRAVAIARKHATEDTVSNTLLNQATVLMEASHDDRAEPLLLDARERAQRAFGPDSTLLATIDLDLALIETHERKYKDAIARLRGALAMQEHAVGKDHPEVAATLFNLADTLDLSKDHAGAIATARRCAAIRAKSLPGSDAYVVALAQLAEFENHAARYADALRDAETAAAAQAPHEDPRAVAWPALERARALIGLHRDPTQVRGLLAAARRAYDTSGDKDRLAEVDALLASLPDR